MKRVLICLLLIVLLLFGIPIAAETTTDELAPPAADEPTEIPEGEEEKTPTLDEPEPEPMPEDPLNEAVMEM